ncbi:hypothetical protein [Leyella lascolaii]|jgi:hypothetical protein|uniref:hypothetical protein n=1 Tax=Leyella lascolaii TaxID=1776379 RepID=UPI002357C4E6|nr:hypothetical protein [Leyella lascolaii]
MEKLFISASCAVLCSGFAFSIYQAANDYGMKENKLHSAIVAQSGSSSGGETDGDVVYYNKVINSISNTDRKNSEASGSITIKSLGGTNSLTVTGLKRNTIYYVSYTDTYCMARKKELCHHSSEKMVVESVVEEDSETNHVGK